MGISTKRDTIASLEDILGQQFDVLDKGFIRVIDYMGSDNSIVQAARVSYGSGTKTTQDDEALIRYLLKNKHTTPFEMCEIKFHIKAPIFVARQWLRHRTANVNEYSARYSILEEDYYLPVKENISYQSKSNKQGRGSHIESQNADQIIEKIDNISKEAFDTYNTLIGKNDTKSDDEFLSREIARVVLPVNTYTQFYWKIDLHNLLHFLRLRIHPHAQYEIRVYAQLILDIIKKWVPSTYKAFNDYIVNSTTFSSIEVEILKKIVNNQPIKKEDYNLSKREWNALITSLDLQGKL